MWVNITGFTVIEITNSLKCYISTVCIALNVILTMQANLKATG